MKTIIHINQHNIRGNIKVAPEERKPVITCKTYKTNDYYNNLQIKDKAGNVLVELVYSPDKPLNCGARAWIECDSGLVDIVGRV